MNRVSICHFFVPYGNVAVCGYVFDGMEHTRWPYHWRTSHPSGISCEACLAAQIYIDARSRLKLKLEPETDTDKGEIMTDQINFAIPADPTWEPLDIPDVLEMDGAYRGRVVAEKPAKDNKGVWFTIELDDDDVKGKRIQKMMPNPAQNEKTLFLWRGLARSIRGDLSVARSGFAYNLGMFVGQAVYFKVESYLDNDGERRSGLGNWLTKSEYEQIVATGKQRWAPQVRASRSSGSGAAGFPGATPAGTGGFPGMPGATPPQPAATPPVATTPAAAPSFPPPAAPAGAPTFAPPAAPTAPAAPSAVPQPAGAPSFVFPGMPAK